MKNTKISSRAGGTASKSGYAKRDDSGAFKGVARESDTRVRGGHQAAGKSAGELHSHKGIARESDTHVRGSHKVAGKSVGEIYSTAGRSVASSGKTVVHSITKNVSFFEKNKSACGSLKNAPADLSYNPDYLETDK